MIFTRRLTEISSEFHAKVDAVNALNEFFPIMYDQFENNLKSEFKNNLELEGSNYDLLDLIGMISSQRLESMHKGEAEFAGFKNPTLVKKLLPLGIYKLHLSKSPKFLKEMSHVFLTSTFYSSLVDIIKAFFIENHELLVNSVADVSFDEIESQSYESSLDFTSMGISSTAKKLKESFELDLSSERDWIQFYEIFERRNSYVHNNGIPTSKYVASFGGDTNSRLEITREYLKDTINLLKKYQHKIEQHFYNHLT